MAEKCYLEKEGKNQEVFGEQKNPQKIYNNDGKALDIDIDLSSSKSETKTCRQRAYTWGIVRLKNLPFVNFGILDTL